MENFNKYSYDQGHEAERCVTFAYVCVSLHSWRSFVNFAELYGEKRWWNVLVSRFRCTHSCVVRRFMKMVCGISAFVKPLLLGVEYMQAVWYVSSFAWILCGHPQKALSEAGVLLMHADNAIYVNAMQCKIRQDPSGHSKLHSLDHHHVLALSPPQITFPSLFHLNGIILGDGLACSNIPASMHASCVPLFLASSPHMARHPYYSRTRCM